MPLPNVSLKPSEPAVNRRTVVDAESGGRTLVLNAKMWCWMLICEDFHPKTADLSDSVLSETAKPSVVQQWTEVERIL